MVCKAKGSPEPWVEWSRDNQQVADVFGQSEADLVLSGVTRTDGGLYTCLAQNVFGTDIKSVQVVVRCKYFKWIHGNRIVTTYYNLVLKVKKRMTRGSSIFVQALHK